MRQELEIRRWALGGMMAASPAGVPGATLRFRKLGVEQKSRETGPPGLRTTLWFGKTCQFQLTRIS